MSIPKEAIERIKKRITIDKNGCWVVSGWNTGNGYANISIGGKTHKVHRVMFQWFYRRTIKKLHVDYICCTRACCNPLHLQACSLKTNNKLRDKRKRRKNG